MLKGIFEIVLCVLIMDIVYDINHYNIKNNIS